MPAMNKNQKTVWLVLIGAGVLVALLVFTSRILDRGAVIHCPDGTNRPRLNAESFETHYSGVQTQLSAKLGPGKELSAMLGSQQLIAMSEAIQLARLHLQALGVSYNGCLVRDQVFTDSLKLYAEMENIAGQLNVLAQSGRSQGDESRASQLTTRFLELAAQNGAK
jgi:hypothetical protein